MRNRLDLILKCACYALAALLVWQLAHIFLRVHLLAQVSVPQLPSLASNTQTNNAQPTTTRTNSPHPNTSTRLGSNTPAKSSSTNSEPPVKASSTNTNKLAGSPATATNRNTTAKTQLAEPGTNSVSAPSKATGSNTLASVNSGTNNATTRSHTAGENHAESASSTNSVSTNSSAALALSAKGTNARPHPAAVASNLPSSRAAARLAHTMPHGFRPPHRKSAKLAELPPAIQARIARITDSEILAPVIHPMPMALLGIAGDFAFLRASNGQTGLVKEGDKLGDLKLLRIGINRVLVEEGGQKKELTIFSGYGGKTLLPEQEKHP